MSGAAAGPNAARYRTTSRSGGGVGGHRTAEPALDRSPNGLSAGAPDPAGRQLDHRNQEADGVGEGRGIAIGPSVTEQVAQGCGGAGPFLQHRPAGRQEGLDVYAREVAAERAARVGAFQDGLDYRA
jgi:hypothetical protein